MTFIIEDNFGKMSCKTFPSISEILFNAHQFRHVECRIEVLDSVDTFVTFL